jgi:SAM-dependent methyltransferase
MTSPPVAPSQSELWNTHLGPTWVAEADKLDAMLAPLGELAVSKLGDLSGARIVDVGCGTGATSRALASRGADVLGIDISAPMVGLARERGGGPSYAVADAASASSDLKFDGLFSRFGVMFFEEPIAAFANLRKMMKPSATLAFVCWGPPTLNIWATEPMAAALPLLPPQPPAPPIESPGPFAFSTEGRAVEILQSAGWKDASAMLWRGPYIVGPTAAEALPTMLKIGPLGRLLREVPSAQEAGKKALVSVLERYEGQSGVAMPAAVWIVTARA